MISEDDEPLEISTERHFSFNRQISTRNLIAFWLLGLCNNFGYVVMLSAAKDILERSKETTNDTDYIENIKDLKCSTISTGAVLLADILPSLAIKLISPFFLHPIPYLARHLLVILFQTFSFLIVAYSKSIAFGLIGVVFASVGAGLGEVTYLSLSSHFHNNAIHSWSSGTGGAGVFGAVAFAILTDHRFLSLTPKNALLAMLTVPAILLITYWQILLSPPFVQRVLPLNPGSWFGQRQSSYSALNSHFPSPASSTDDLHNLLYGNEAEHATATIRKILHTKIRAIKPLLKFMVPLTTVYFAEYLINQGLMELLIFDSSHSFKLSPMQQYRWNQVLYQIGVFISRSSVHHFPIRPIFIPLLAILQFGNALFLLEESYFGLHLPHLLFLMAIILYEGLLGGAAYVNTFSAIHRTIAKSKREFSIAFVAISDSFGIVLAGFAAIPMHNFICNHRLNVINHQKL